jgi:hypothetical protein
MAKSPKIMLIRHAEKPDGNIQGVDPNGTDGKEYLTVQGWQRAGALARFFSPLDKKHITSGIDEPQYLFASGPVSGKEPGSKSYRPEETITPLSQLLGPKVPFDLNYVQGQEGPVAAAAKACDGVALIAWQHEDIPAIGDAILGKPDGTLPKWPGDRFDLVWVFDLSADGDYKFSQVPQMLLAGDQSSIIPT